MTNISPETLAARVRDRLLLYARGMDADPLLGMEIATESMRRALARGAELTPQAAMAEMHDLLREKGISPQVLDAEGQRLRSTPPMNRRPMVAEELERSPLRRIARKIGLKKAASKQDAA